MSSRVLLILLALSLVANAALFWFGKNNAGPDSTQATPQTGVNVAAAQSGAAKNKDLDRGEGNGTAPLALAWEKLFSEDLATMAANLRKAGLSEKFVRFVINAEIAERFRARREAIWPEQKLTEWWRSYQFQRPPLKARMAMLDLTREQNKLSKQILGVAPETDADSLPISADKREEVQFIVEDYNAMKSSLSGGMLTPSEREKLKILDEERRKDLAALLSPEEIEKVEIATSNTTQNLNYSLLRGQEVTEDEFKELYAVQKAYDDKRQAQVGSKTYDAWRAEQAELAQKYAVILGEERSKELLRNTNYEYRNLLDLTRRNGFSDQTANEIIAIKEALSKESLALRDDDTLTNEQKLEQLKTRAQVVESQILTKLGQDVGKAYLSQSGFIQSMKNGAAIELSPLGYRIDVPVTMKRKPNP